MVALCRAGVAMIIVVMIEVHACMITLHLQDEQPDLFLLLLDLL